MAKKDTFDNMYTLYTAIDDIDKIINDPNEINQNGECKLDQILFYVKDIPKKSYNPELSATIISCIRQAVVELYEKEAATITDCIVVGTAKVNVQDDSSKQKLVVTDNTRVKSRPTFPTMNLPVTPAPEIRKN